MATKNEGVQEDGARTLSHPCGFCRNGLHDLCPKFVHGSSRSDDLLACPCEDCPGVREVVIVTGPITVGGGSAASGDDAEDAAGDGDVDEAEAA